MPTDKQWEQIKDRKEKSIAFHSAGNIAAELMRNLEIRNKTDILRHFRDIRIKLYNDWQNWAIENIIEQPKISQEKESKQHLDYRTEGNNSGKDEINIEEKPF